MRLLLLLFIGFTETLTAQTVPFAFFSNRPNKITISDVTVIEGNNLSFTVSLSRPAARDLNINWSTADNTALAATHYAGAIVIGSINHANVCANDLTFYLNLLSTSDGKITDAQGVGTIQDNDLPSLAIASNGDVIEGINSVATVTLSQACNNKTVSFLVSSSNGTAVSGQDFVAISNQSFTALPGVTSVAVTISTFDDFLDEDDSQNYTLTISSPVNATLGTASTSMNILDNDLPPTLAIAPTYRLTEGGVASIAVTLSSPSERAVGFLYSTVDGTATAAANDFTSATNVSTSIAAGSTTLTLPITVTNDAVSCEDEEVFNVSLSSTTNATDGNLTSAVTIVDFNLPTITLAGASGVEGTTLNFDVTLDFACPSNNMTFYYTTINGTAHAGDDFTFARNQLTVLAGNTTGQISISTIDDAVRDGDSEQFYVTVDQPQYSKVGSASIATGTITDNEVGVVTTQVVAGFERSCALSSEGNVKCWGHKTSLGYNGGHRGDEPGEMGDNIPLVDFGTNAANAGAQHTVLDGIMSEITSCVLLDNNRLKCMGGITYGGALGTNLLGARYGSGVNEMGNNLPYVDLGSVGGLGVTPLSVNAVVGVGDGYCALISDGKIKCWGFNDTGQMGRGDNTGANARIGDQAGEMGDNLPYVNLGSVNGLGVTPHTAKQITGGSSPCALLNDDRVKCWGTGWDGALGTGNTNHLGDGPNEMGDNLPYVNFGTGRTVKKLYPQCAILDNDRLKCWGVNGANSVNQPNLGLGDTNARGDNANEMGDNLPYVDLGTRDGLGITAHTVKQIAKGRSHICALLDDNRVKCWGNGGYLGYGNTNRLGDGPNEMGDNLPYVNFGTGRTALKIFAQELMTYILRDDGTLVGFGNNVMGELGRGDIAGVNGLIGDQPGEMGDSLVTIDVGTGLTVDRIISRNAHSRSTVCAILSNQQVKCWGEAGPHGGDGTARLTLGIGDDPGEMGGSLPTVSLPTGVKATRLFVGQDWPGFWGFHVAASLDNGKFTSWGNFLNVVNLSTQFGNFAPGSSRAMGDTLLQGTFAGNRAAIKFSIAINSSISYCAIDSQFDLRCSGNRIITLNGTATDAHQVPTSVPIALVGTNRKVIDLAMFHLGQHACALLDNLTVKCWGVNTSGQLGYGDQVTRGQNAATSGDNLLAINLGTVSYPVQVSVGESHSCARFANGGVKCWGLNTSGQLGYGDTTMRGDGPNEMGDNLPFVNLGTGRTAKAIFTSASTTCAIRDNGTLVCWGANDGLLGRSSTANVGTAANQMGDNLVAVDLNGDLVRDLSLSKGHACALTEANTVKCWGYNFWGQLGQGDVVRRGHAAATMGVNLPAVSLGW